jgi:hypothetical protein
MHTVAIHADMERESSRTTVGNELRDSTYLDGSTLLIRSSRQLRDVTPGSTHVWATFQVELRDPYGRGAFGKQTEVDACYQLDYSY